MTAAFSSRRTRMPPAFAALLLLGACSPNPGGQGSAVAAPVSAPRVAGVEQPAAAPGDAAAFCEPFTAMAGQSCSARYSCAEPALAELRVAACGCRSGTLPPPAERERLAALLRQTRSFACCAGIAIARNGAGCP